MQCHHTTSDETSLFRARAAAITELEWRMSWHRNPLSACVGGVLTDVLRDHFMAQLEIDGMINSDCPLEQLILLQRDRRQQVIDLCRIFVDLQRNRDSES